MKRLPSLFIKGRDALATLVIAIYNIRVYFKYTRRIYRDHYDRGYTYTCGVILEYARYTTPREVI